MRRTVAAVVVLVALVTVIELTVIASNRTPDWNDDVNAGAAAGAGFANPIAALSQRASRVAPSHKGGGAVEAHEGVAGEGDSVDWNAPFLDGAQVRNEADASSRLSFSPAVPAAAGSPIRIYTHAPERPKNEQGVAFVYDDAPYGRFLVEEERGTITPTDLQILVDDCAAATYCDGMRKVVGLKDGTPALLIAGSASTGVLWGRNGVRFYALGPPTSFSIDDAEAIANTTG